MIFRMYYIFHGIILVSVIGAHSWPTTADGFQNNSIYLHSIMWYTSITKVTHYYLPKTQFVL